MSAAAFPSPAAEMAEMNRIQYEMEYTEGINQRMRVPEKLKVAPPNADLEQSVLDGGLPNASVTMQVPERIVVAGTFTFGREVLLKKYCLIFSVADYCNKNGCFDTVSTVRQRPTC